MDEQKKIKKPDEQKEQTKIEKPTSVLVPIENNKISKEEAINIINNLPDDKKVEVKLRKIKFKKMKLPKIKKEKVHTDPDWTIFFILMKIGIAFIFVVLIVAIIGIFAWAIWDAINNPAPNPY